MKTAIFPRYRAMKLARLAASGSIGTITKKIQSIVNHTKKSPSGNGWKENLQKILDFLKRNGSPSFQVFIPDGNRKLPFFAYSTLPVVNCPGKGECAIFCYSLKSWHHPSAFCRQVQNTLLERFFTAILELETKKIPEKSIVRLYVDGDFSNRGMVEKWFAIMAKNPELKFYGYSKSWDELFGHSEYPFNYKIRLSSGGSIRSIDAQKMAQLPIFNGHFLAVSIDGNDIPKKNAIKFSLPIYHERVRKAGSELLDRKIFSCPGSCGSCVKDIAGGNYHACADTRFKTIPIAIGIH